MESKADLRWVFLFSFSKSKGKNICKCLHNFIFLTTKSKNCYAKTKRKVKSQLPQMQNEFQKKKNSRKNVCASVLACVLFTIWKTWHLARYHAIDKYQNKKKNSFKLQFLWNCNSLFTLCCCPPSRYALFTHQLALFLCFSLTVPNNSGVFLNSC